MIKSIGANYYQITFRLSLVGGLTKVSQCIFPYFWNVTPFAVVRKFPDKINSSIFTSNPQFIVLKNIELKIVAFRLEKTFVWLKVMFKFLFSYLKYILHFRLIQIISWSNWSKPSFGGTCCQTKSLYSNIFFLRCEPL